MFAAISLAGTFTTLHSFTGGTNDGGSTLAALLQGGDGIFYGTTQFGGMYGEGTVFEISTNGALTGLYSFTRTARRLSRGRFSAGLSMN